MEAIRVLLACDKFKSCLSGDEAGEAIEAGLRRGLDRLAPDIIPQFRYASIADGGEGFAAGIVHATGGEWIRSHAHDALARPIDVSFGLIRIGDHRVAVMEMAEAAGLWRIAEADRSPLHATTRGVGEMLRAAAELSPDEIWLGIGGSATNDGGAGLAHALGWRFLDQQGKELDPCPAELTRLMEVQEPQDLQLPTVRVACDVTNELLGSEGATRIFGPQKGLASEQLEEVESALARLVEATARHDLAEFPGAGAAGGLGFGLMAFARARCVSGFELYAEATGLLDSLQWADLIVTGEGSLDQQSLQGKGPVALTRLARDYAIPCHAVAGRVEAGIPESGEFSSCHSVSEHNPSLSIEELIARGHLLLEELAEASLAPLVAQQALVPRN